MVILHLFLHKIAFVFYAVLIQANIFQANPVESECSSCVSKDCISHARGIIRNLKPDVDPCDDFFSFACGAYMERFGKNDTHSVYDDTMNYLQIQIKGLLENLQPEEGSELEKLKTLFDTCIKKDFSELQAVPDALEFLKQAGIPNWPNMDSSFQFAELSDTLGVLAAYGEFAFITFKRTPYEEMENSNSLQPAIIFPGRYLLSSKIKQKDLRNSILRILSYFNVDKEKSEVIWNNFKIIEDIGMQLQNEESQNHLGCRGISRRTHTTVNCSEETNTSLKFLCNVWKSAVESGNLGQYFSEDTMHISCRWNSFHYAESIFSSLANISHRSLADYLSLRFFLNHIDDLNLYFHLIQKTYPEDKGSSAKTPEPINRWEYCIGFIMKSMNLALGYEYTRQHVTPSLENDALDMIQDYVQSLTNAVQSQNWIKDEVKVYLVKQLENLEIGFKITMQKFRNQTLISNYYKEYHPVKDSFLKNVLEMGKFSVITKEKTHFNSFYSSSDPYTMDFGLALFLPPTYSYGLPKIWNYATLGSVIGHELIHNLKFYFDLVSLDNETEVALGHKMQCYIEQYSPFIMEKTGKTVSSNEAKEEIMADNIGWELSEKVLEHIIETSDSLFIPGLEYTAQQLMYISLAQDSCDVLSKEVEKEFYSSKPHNLQKLRILSKLQNSKMFSETFNCSSSKIMNPEDKCRFFVDV